MEQHRASCESKWLKKRRRWNQREQSDLSLHCGRTFNCVRTLKIYVLDSMNQLEPPQKSSIIHPQDQRVSLHVIVWRCMCSTSCPALLVTPEDCPQMLQQLHFDPSAQVALCGPRRPSTPISSQPARTICSCGRSHRKAEQLSNAGTWMESTRDVHTQQGRGYFREQVTGRGSGHYVFMKAFLCLFVRVCVH